MRSELNEVKQKKWTANPWNLKDISFFLYATARENSQDLALFPLYQAASVGGV